MTAENIVKERTTHEQPVTVGKVIGYKILVRHVGHPNTHTNKNNTHQFKNIWPTPITCWKDTKLHVDMYKTLQEPSVNYTMAFSIQLIYHIFFRLVASKIEGTK